jgi:hypothetical protein
MPKNREQLRIETYFKLSSQIAHLDNGQLHALFDTSAAFTGWGINHTISIGSSKVFVKRVPLTNIEYDNMFSTKNLYDLPTYYNYGIGSAGFGVFRELVTHIKTTNWVLEGTIATFPLMYHYRIMPFSGTRADMDMQRHTKYVEYWGNSANVGKYVFDRANASYEVVLFLEHIPYTAGTWLVEHPNKTQMVMDDMRATITFLRKNGILHLDPHFSNILTDGKRAYLTDFGLVLDKRFALTPAEKVFLKQNTYYDYGEFLWALGSLLVEMYRRLPDTHKTRIAEKFGVRDEVEFDELMLILLNNIEELYVDGIMKVDRSYVASIVHYRSIITLMHNFYSDIRRSNKKDTQLPHAALRRLLKETRFVCGTVANG